MIYAVFLRGMNTGKRKLLMSDFKTILAAAGCRSATTIQAAGTAVFDAEEGTALDIQSEIERQLSRLIGKPVSSIIKNIDEIKAITEHGTSLKSAESFQDYIMLTDDPAVFTQVCELHKPIAFIEGERLIEGSGYFIWTVRKGHTLDEFGSKVLGSKKFRETLTSRNLNTIQKVCMIMNDLAKTS